MSLAPGQKKTTIVQPAAGFDDDIQADNIQGAFDISGSFLDGTDDDQCGPGSRAMQAAAKSPNQNGSQFLTQKGGSPGTNPGQLVSNDHPDGANFTKDLS